MLIRFAIKNLFSFKEETEFNLLPGRTKRLNHHKYERNGVEVLKLTALYGANGSGKSNLIRSISLLKTMLLSGVIPIQLNTQKFKLAKSCLNEPIELAIEFFVNELIYYYSISINEGNVIDEYFSHNDLSREDVLIFHRSYANNKSSIKFSPEFENFRENQVLKNIIEKDLLKKHQPLFFLLNEISNAAFHHIKTVTHWLTNGLTIIFPETKANGLAESIDSEDSFKAFANELMCSFNTGITNLKVEVKNIEDYFGNENQNELEIIKNAIRNSPSKWLSFANRPSGEDDVVFVNEKDGIVTKRLLFEHQGESSERVEFKLSEESDGTKRLLEYIPAWTDLISYSDTFIIDEIERSIHPLIIKELIDKFSKDENTKGQLIFSTHESNLLDQEVFRTDEIWFTEKNVLGATKLYSLSDFKEHNTIDIRKGYLNGRYGAIPFLGNLHDLNWHKFQDEKE